MEVWIATGNKGKLNEFKLLLSELEAPLKELNDKLEIHSQGELSYFAAPDENGKTFEENARIKARALKSVKPNTWVIADDSGLEVEGLGGIPGIHSARYAGPKASDGENMAKLLKMMTIRPMNNRNARFTCCLVVYSPTGEEFVLNGSLEGVIAKAPKGTMGFGYDPVFVPNGETLTLAELTPGYKNKNSHRAKATQQLNAKIIEILKK